MCHILQSRRTSSSAPGQAGYLSSPTCNNSLRETATATPCSSSNSTLSSLCPLDSLRRRQTGERGATSSNNCSGSNYSSSNCSNCSNSNSSSNRTSTRSGRCTSISSTSSSCNNVSSRWSCNLWKKWAKRRKPMRKRIPIGNWYALRTSNRQYQYFAFSFYPPCIRQILCLEYFFRPRRTTRALRA